MKVGDVHTVLRSERAGGKHGYFVTIRSDTRCSASNLEDAKAQAHHHTTTLLAFLSLAGNGAIDQPELVAAHGSDLTGDGSVWEGHSWPPSNEIEPPASKPVSPASVVAMMNAWWSLQEKETFARSVGHYSEALRQFRPGQALLCAEFLWLATEGLSRSLTEIDATNQGVTPKKLMKQQGLARVELLYRKHREETIFPHDPDGLRALEDASNGFEHIYRDHSHAIQEIEPLLPGLATSVREALLETLGLKTAVVNEVTSDQLATVRSLHPTKRFVLGKIRSTSASPEPLAEALEAEWAIGPVHAEASADGSVHLSRPADVSFPGLRPDLRVELEAFGTFAPGFRPVEPFEQATSDLSLLWREQATEQAESRLRDALRSRELSLAQATNRLALWTLRATPVSSSRQDLLAADRIHIAHWQLLLLATRESCAGTLLLRSGYHDQAMKHAMSVHAYLRQSESVSDVSGADAWLSVTAANPQPHQATPGEVLGLLATASGRPTAAPAIEPGVAPAWSQSIPAALAQDLRKLVGRMLRTVAIEPPDLSTLDSALSEIDEVMWDHEVDS
jgi:hypothetical protein